METKNQIKLLKKYSVSNYTIENGITINGSLDLRSLTTVDKDFLKDTTVTGSLYLHSLTTADKDLMNKNISQLAIGYNEKKSYCFFDGILSAVLSVSNRKPYTIYTTPFGFIAQKDDYTAHGKTVKKSILDLEFKIISEKIKNDPIHADTKITIKHYRLITGACESGCKDWMSKNNIPFKVVDNEIIEVEPILAKDLLPILKKSNAYGLNRFEALINF